MNRRLVFRPLARVEYVSSAEWYDAQQPGLGRAFEAEVQSVLLAILDHPKRYMIAIDDIREASVSRFPFSVYYRVRGDVIVVVSVFHQSRDPSEWQSRS